jgi:hypothetical protein
MLRIGTAFASGPEPLKLQSEHGIPYILYEPRPGPVHFILFEIQNAISKKDYILWLDGIVVLSNDLKKRYIGLLSFSVLESYTTELMS